MALRIIVQNGDPILKKKCRPVEKFDAKLHQLLDDMGETLLKEDGYGLAAPQVGVMRRLFVMLDESTPPAHAPKASEEDPAQAAGQADCANEAEELAEEQEPVILEFINPEIIERGEFVRGYEGCLSFPGQFGAIARPKRAKVRAQDRFGNEFEYEGEGIMARCLCHESDHLDGVTIDDLAEYFYDPETPHDLDGTLVDRPAEEEEA